ncbi:folylpolyglutamate synthase [Clostridium homopropionicum DSM 5847]|uniref:tetrahydrofolate synthase n=1 Tax=Clostridium homopropionicum DSM 5847 TaxID=1121318 RepID=A0A0L6ZB55_9CLOT|nr:folylpolyglutamate synthase/dihydrofolate synthase family protein [Clostridium homopropionicum]KOA20204.1 folylpolyglutamate synthase [Clostridium homopropionicum DSM 5847]SFG59224.1 dihydrofolate synthase / folylpolyglutamate synthase [Clostridium homopropionicum]
MNYLEAMEYIDDLAKFSMKLGLSRTGKILELLGNPQEKLRCIHIAGTNGKGSTTAMISKILIENGYKVGMYTSPFIEEFEERIQINNLNIPKDELAEVISKVANAVEKVIELGYDNPTQFEVITCAGLLYFYKQAVDFAVIEVGLGGRLDSTNLITPILSIITSISYDHMNVLGNTLSEIAYEKAGIIKETVPVILYPQEEEAERVIEKVSLEKGTRLIKVPANSAKLLGVRDAIFNDKIIRVQDIKIDTKDNKYNISLTLLGRHQILNCATVIYSIEELKRLGIEISNEAIEKGLSKVKWIGRMEILERRPLTIIDGAHNIDGIVKLRESLEEYLNYKDVVLILGILADKQVEAMIRIIAPIAKRIICVTPHSDRGELAATLKSEVEKYNTNCEAIEDYKKAYEKAISYCSEDDLLLISGSLYMIGDMRKVITNKHLV